MNAASEILAATPIYPMIPGTVEEDEPQRSPWETIGEFRVRQVLDEALFEWRAQGSLAPHTAMTMATQLVIVCRQEPEATWCALSLLDQFHRRKVIATELFRYLTEELSQSALATV